MARRAFSVAFLAIAVLVGPAHAQAVHSLEGRVALPNGQPPQTPVKVTLRYNGMRVLEVFTDLSGRFYFTGVRPGNYHLIAEGDGQTFETTTVSAEVGLLSRAPQTFFQNISLHPKAAQPLPSAAVTSTEALDPNLPPVARQQYEKGLKQARDNHPEKAIKCLEEAVTVHPQFYSAHVALAEQYAKVERDQEAAAAYQKAMALKPDRVPAYIGFGVMLVKQKRYDEAIAPLRWSVELDKKSSAPYLFLGLAEMMTGDFQSAESNLLRSYEIGKPPLARMYLANLYELKGEPAKAIEQLKAFLDESPNLADERRAQIAQVIDKLRKRGNSKK